LGFGSDRGQEEAVVQKLQIDVVADIELLIRSFVIWTPV
jgi:hypothetical protein